MGSREIKRSDTRSTDYLGDFLAKHMELLESKPESNFRAASVHQQDWQPTFSSPNMRLAFGNEDEMGAAQPEMFSQEPKPAAPSHDGMTMADTWEHSDDRDLSSVHYWSENQGNFDTSYTVHFNDGSDYHGEGPFPYKRELRDKNGDDMFADNDF